MNKAIKVLCWWTIVIHIFSMASLVLSSGQSVEFTPLMSILNIALGIPIIALAILVLIRIRHQRRRATRINPAKTK